MDPAASSDVESENETAPSESDGDGRRRTAQPSLDEQESRERRTSRKNVRTKETDETTDKEQENKGLSRSASRKSVFNREVEDNEKEKDSPGDNEQDYKGGDRSASRKSVRTKDPEAEGPETDQQPSAATGSSSGDRKSIKPVVKKSFTDPSTSVSKDKGKASVQEEQSTSLVNPDEPVSAARKPSRRQWGSARNFSRESSDTESLVDDADASYIRDVMKKRRSTKESTLNDRPILGDSGVPEFETRVMALKMAVQHHELPMQLAYEELDELAANADRLRAAIETNINMLTLHMKRSELRYMRSAFTAWRLYTDQKRAKGFDMKNATDYYLRRMLSRAFQAWRTFLLREKKIRRLEVSAQKFLRRHLLQRIWGGWTSLVRRRLREDERHRREKQLVRELQERQRECVGRRAVNAIRRRRLQRALYAFKVGIEISRGINARYNHIFYFMNRNKLAKALKFWAGYSKRSDRYARIYHRRERKILTRCFWHWEDEAVFSKFCERRMNRRRTANSFSRWMKFVNQSVRHDNIMARMTRWRLRRQFHDFREGCLEMRWRKRTQKRAIKKCNFLKMRLAFQAWICYMQMQAHKRMINLEDYVAQLEKENLRTRSECDRLGRIVDSGEWDQQRVAELEQASQILSGERDALTKLVGRLERDRHLALEQQNQQEAEISHLKEQIMGSNFMHRNKLLVRGASSFNSVVRAVKSEVLKKGVNPEVVYSIDNMSMDQVSVFPDGDLRVKPLSKFDKGKWAHRSGTEATKTFMDELPTSRGMTPRKSFTKGTLVHHILQSVIPIRVRADHAGVY